MWGYVKGGRITDIFTPYPQHIDNLKTTLGIQKLVLICGEAPGKQEDIRSMIFIGKSGNLLRRQICEVGHDFIFCLTNTVCCRPPNNRAPTKEEKKECKTHLDHILESYPFDLSVLVGKHAENVRTRTETIFIKHPAWILRQDYPLIPYMEIVDELRRGLSSIKITV